MAEKLFNNIEIPEQWPPKYTTEQLVKGQPVPYIENPPEVIDISLGRQLFVDDFIVLWHDICPVYHRAKKYEGNPVLFPETPMEKLEKLPFAAPKDGGVWFDKDEKKFKMWYEAGWLHKMAYAESCDGIHWERPNLHITEGTNEILAERNNYSEDGNPTFFRPDSTSVIIDYDTKDKNARYKLFMRKPGISHKGIVAVSADGIHFTDAKFCDTMDDRSTMFYNPFRKKWVYSIRTGWHGRTRNYYECDDPIKDHNWGDRSVQWLCADKSIKPNAYTLCDPQLYNFNAIAYESIMFGLFEVHYGPDNKVCWETGAPKITELIPVYSRDGFHFSKPSNKAIIQASMTEGSWDRGYVQSVSGGLIVYKDEMRIYYSGVAGDESKGGTGSHYDGQYDTMYSGGATGFATLRRDGFVSLYADEEGKIFTRDLVFHGKKKYFFINARTDIGGSITVQITAPGRHKIYAESSAFTGDSTCAMLDFGSFDLSSLEGERFTLIFSVGGAEIYSFWFSESENGESGGYDGAGNPEL